MHFRTAFIPLLLALVQPVFSAAVQVNILVDDNQASTKQTTPFSLSHSVYNTDTLDKGPIGPFRLRAVDTKGNDIIGNHRPLYFDMAFWPKWPKTFAIIIGDYRRTTVFEIQRDSSKLLYGGSEEVGAMPFGIMVMGSNAISVRMEFSIVYSNIASGYVLATKDGNPNIFVVKEELDDLLDVNYVFACVADKTDKSCPSDRTRIYLKVEQIKDNAQNEL